MATRALFVFNNAMALMDEFSTEMDEHGRYNPNEEDTIEYRSKTPAILNILMGELYPYSDNYPKDALYKRPIVTPLHSLDDDIPLDDYICRTVMPYGLAAHLLIQEDPSTANYFQQRYDELKAKLAVGMPTESADIVDVYGGGEYVDVYDANGNIVGRQYIAYDPLGFDRGGRWG